MQYRKFKADRLFDGYKFRNEGDVLITDEKGIVQEIVSINDAGDDIQHFNGILSPGLINCHCHLELSHLKNVIPPHTGLIDFLISVVTKRDFDAAIIQQEIERAEREMLDNGIIAVGDIGNSTNTITVKNKSSLYWHNFVEVLSFKDENAEKRIAEFKQIAAQFESAGSASLIQYRTSLVPHAPYSISPKTFQLINEVTAGQIISIHNQENPAENELYQTGTGDFLKLFSKFGFEGSPFPVTGKTSIRSYLPYFNRKQTIFLVHNSFMPEEDIVWANEYAAANQLKLIYCICINANLYIENKVPPVELFEKHNCHLVLGTDSYSSNWQLSIAKEMEVLLKHTNVTTEQALQMATINGAKALQIDDYAGSFEQGKKPGVVLLKNDFSESKRIL